MMFPLHVRLTGRTIVATGLPLLLLFGFVTNPGRVEAISLSQAIASTVGPSTWPGTIVNTEDIGAITTTSAAGPSTTLLKVSVPGETRSNRAATTKKPKKKPTTTTTTGVPGNGVAAGEAKSGEAGGAKETKSAEGFDTTITTVMPAGSVPDLFPESTWLALRKCESNNNYAINTGNGYYGAYQFALGTWKRLGYSGSPHKASPVVQDEAAKRLQIKSGWGQWPACTRKLGLR